MKLGRLLEFHQNNSSELGLANNFGDGFLIQHNSLYGKVRASALKLGFSFNDQHDPKYLALPLSQLETILKTKKIPYFDNVSVLKEVETKVKNVTVWDDVTDNLKQNHVFHESCHAISRSISDTIFKNDLSKDEITFRLLIEESFSNACELLGIMDVEDTAHRIFYELNSYIFMYDERSQLKRLVSEIGLPSTIKALMGFYLFSNFLHERIKESDFDRLLKLLDLDKQPTPVLKTMRSISKIAFELNPRFRWVTTTFYLRLNGIATTSEAINKIDFLKMLSQTPEFLSAIQRLSQFDM